MKKTSSSRRLVESQATKMQGTQELKYTIDEETELIVKVHPVLPFSKRTELIRRIVDWAFMNEGKTLNDYNPEFVEFSKRSNIISYFTDFEVPKRVNEAWLVLNYTSLYDDVIKIVGSDIEKILAEADEIIKVRVNYLERKTDFNDFFERIAKKIETYGEDFSGENLQKIVKLAENLPNLSSENIIKSIIDIERDNEKNKVN